MVKLKEITDKSWLVISDTNENIGILSELPTKTFTFLGNEVKTSFNDKDEIVEFFQEDIFGNIVKPKEDSKKEHFVKGYPVAHENPYEVEDEVTSDLPLYKKTEDSKVYHAAGYYCINFPKGWLQAYCPKYTTLGKYEYVGPFKNSQTMKAEHRKLKRNDER